MNRPEILAPAGSMESLTAAVNCGADAVYLGGKALNARRNAGNFDDAELRQAVEYCHLHGTKVLQTLNIVMFDEELPELEHAVQMCIRDSFRPAAPMKPPLRSKRKEKSAMWGSPSTTRRRFSRKS